MFLGRSWPIRGGASDIYVRFSIPIGKSCPANSSMGVESGLVLGLEGWRLANKNRDLTFSWDVVFFTLTDRASTIPSTIRGCQSGTTAWSAGHKEIRGTSTKL